MSRYGGDVPDEILAETAKQLKEVRGDGRPLTRWSWGKYVLPRVINRGMYVYVVANAVDDKGDGNYKRVVVEANNPLNAAKKILGKRIKGSGWSWGSDEAFVMDGRGTRVAMKYKLKPVPASANASTRNVFREIEAHHSIEEEITKSTGKKVKTQTFVGTRVNPRLNVDSNYGIDAVYLDRLTLSAAALAAQKIAEKALRGVNARRRKTVTAEEMVDDAVVVHDNDEEVVAQPADFYVGFGHHSDDDEE